MTKQQIAARSGLELAFVGDAVYELFIREHLVQKAPNTVGALQQASSLYARATQQCEAYWRIEPLLNETEQAVFLRGRNAKPKSVPKNASPGEYAAATGFEAVIGYLYLSGQHDRLQTLLNEIHTFE